MRTAIEDLNYEQIRIALLFLHHREIGENHFQLMRFQPKNEPILYTLNDQIMATTVTRYSNCVTGCC